MLKNDYLEMTQIIQHTKAKMDKWTSWDKDRLLHHTKKNRNIEEYSGSNYL